MTLQQILFLVLALIAAGAALAVVTLRNLTHAALSLLLAFLAVGGLYALLEAPLFAVAQALVNVGAVGGAIWMAVLLTRDAPVEREPGVNAQWWAAALLAALLLVVLVWQAWLLPARYGAPLPDDPGSPRWYLVLAAALFAVGVYGLLARRHAVAALMGLTLMFTAAVLTLLAFWRHTAAGAAIPAFAAAVLGIAAAQAGVGLAHVITLWRTHWTVDLDDVDGLRG